MQVLQKAMLVRLLTESILTTLSTWSEGWLLKNNQQVQTGDARMVREMVNLSHSRRLEKLVWVVKYRAKEGCDCPLETQD